jgi:hypothetical protein
VKKAPAGAFFNVVGFSSQHGNAYLQYPYGMENSHPPQIHGLIIRFLIRLSLCGALLCPLALYAEEHLEDLPPKPSFIDLQRNFVSDKFVNLASTIDSFFGTERNFQESNKSVFQFDATQVMGRNGNPNTALTYRAKLHLPNAQKSFHLLLESNPDKNLPGSTPGNQLNQRQQALLFREVTTPDSYGTSLRFENNEDSPWRISADGGLKADNTDIFSGISIHPFARSSASYILPLDTVQLKLTQSIFNFNTTGTGENTQFEVGHQFDNKTLVRSTSGATFLYDSQYFDLHQDISLFHTVDQQASLLYQLSANGRSRPSSEVSEYVALVLYRRRVHRDWVFLEISPQLHYPKVTNFLLDAQFIARLEFMFSQ